MTREEAIEMLNNVREYTNDEAIDMAIEALSAPTGADLIRRQDAIDAIHSYFKGEIDAEPTKMMDGYEVCADMQSVNKKLHDNKMLSRAIKALPSARPTVIRSKMLMPTKDFKEWAKRMKEENGDVIVIPCDAEVVSARPTGEWTKDGQFWKCSNCVARIFSETEIDRKYHHAFCGVCGADMRGGDSNV